ncbi:MAG: hypothetical protein SFV54_05780 [Bryobacteraceae bacterium]|nr:hypothetical protein [Bryobacteraceae bacterium]
MVRLAILSLATLFCAATAAHAQLAEGVYTGSYKGSAENSAGTVRLALTRNGETWGANFTFTAAGREVKCKTVTIDVNGDRVKFACAWEFDGYSFETTSDAAAASRGKLESKYRTVAKPDGSKIDEGVWTATLESK